jgi:hypothetical protein
MQTEVCTPNLLDRLLTVIPSLLLCFISGFTPLLGQTGSITPTQSSPITITRQPPTIILKRFEGLLDKVQDRSPVGQDMAYNTLLTYIARLSPSEISQRVNPRIKYKDLLLTPERYRGEIIRVEGFLIYLRPYRLDTNPADINVYYSGMIGDPGSDEYFKFHIIEKPLERLITHEETFGKNIFADQVRLEGAFLKIEQYPVDPRYGQGETYAPFLMGRTITKVQIEPPPGATQFKIVIGILTGFAFIFLVFLIIISARREKSLQKRLQDIKKIPR